MPKKSEYRETAQPFKPRARMLLLLGEQLIRDAGIAVFELVKNGYDADATLVQVKLLHVTDPENGRIIIEDNGCGMTWEIVRNVWLEPGTDFREQQKITGKRTPKGRIPLGEKGIGRFAAHKLGESIRMVTRSSNSPEVIVDIDWGDFRGKKYLNETDVKIKERKPTYFEGNMTGTRIEISRLRESLSRGMVRQIHRAVTSISSPLNEPSEFKTEFHIEPESSFISGLFDVNTALELAPYSAICIVDGDLLTYDYEFTPYEGMERVEGRSERNVRIQDPELINLFNADMVRSNIGEYSIEFRLFDLSSQVLNFATSDKKGLKDFLRFNGGVRVYRDGIRVYNYGEPGTDWLELGVRRVNHPTMHLSSNQIIGAVHLSGADSSGLIEKTNREGFIENEVFSIFKQQVSFALAQIELERNRDKSRIRAAYSTRKLKEPVIEETGILREKLKQSYPKNQEELLPLIDSIEQQYVRMRDNLLTAAGAGLTLTILIHEVEKAIKNLSTAIARQSSFQEIEDNAKHLEELIEGFTSLTRKSKTETESAGRLITQAIFNMGYRIRAHNVQVINGVSDGNDPDLMIKCTKRWIIACLMNLIDNSIYWLKTVGSEEKNIYIGTRSETGSKPVLFVADNGPGFYDPPEMLVEPFMTRKSDGMGLGLHIVNEVMKVHEGRLFFPSREDLDIEEKYSGAIIAMQFKE